jgi:hypothetical protein
MQHQTRNINTFGSQRRGRSAPFDIADMVDVTFLDNLRLKAFLGGLVACRPPTCSKLRVSILCQSSSSLKDSCNKELEQQKPECPAVCKARNVSLLLRRYLVWDRAKQRASDLFSCVQTELSSSEVVQRKLNAHISLNISLSTLYSEYRRRHAPWQSRRGRKAYRPGLVTASCAHEPSTLPIVLKSPQTLQTSVHSVSCLP